MRDLQKDLELCNAASPGPWELEEWPETHEVALVRQGHSRGEPPICVFDTAYEGRANAQFFVQAREGWPEAIRRAMEAETLVGKLRSVLQELLYAGQCDVCLQHSAGACRLGLGVEACIRLARSQARQVLEECQCSVNPKDGS